MAKVVLPTPPLPLPIAITLDFFSFFSRLGIVTLQVCWAGCREITSETNTDDWSGNNQRTLVPIGIKSKYPL